ncbi:ribokinase [Paracoccus xiamenensis]|uniref:ribokinase n=1 Tax=Paracoccus xiamenensis TaxID=2714901 RepID=UPI00140E450F|nr:ribokinase [Paracoccus xiamenensis]NHF72896.1 ribokinase [Paracoccus xiamenensis]
MSKGRIGVVGSNMIDVITYTDRMPGPGETIEAPDFELGFGGKGANQAVAAARLGSQVMMVGCVGGDMFGDQQIQNFQDNGIDGSHVHVISGKSSGVAPIFVEPSGENSILIIKGANAALSPAHVDQATPALADCAVILMQLEVPLEVNYHTIAWASAQGITTVLNPAPASPDLDVSRLAGLSFFCPNETELATLTGMPTGTDADIVAAARHLIAQGIGQVVVTLGGRGARLVTSDAVQEIAPVKVTPVDTTGAGDAFIGSFAHYLASGMGAPKALREAARYAATSITRRGTQKSYLTASELDGFSFSSRPKEQRITADVHSFVFTPKGGPPRTQEIHQAQIKPSTGRGGEQRLSIWIQTTRPGETPDDRGVEGWESAVIVNLNPPVPRLPVDGETITISEQDDPDIWFDDFLYFWDHGRYTSGTMTITPADEGWQISFHGHCDSGNEVSFQASFKV